VKSERPYHHGNLRETLLDSAVDLIRENGPDAFTLREVARRAGVSHNAPYRHFKHKEDLLNAVAAQGFERLTASMLETAAASSDSAERLRLSGCGYVAFALRWPQHFSVMFDRPPSEEKDPALADAGRRAFQTLVEFIAGAQDAGTIPPGDPLPHALLAWSLVHGIAKLAIGGRLPFTSPDDVIAFTRTATGALARPAPEL
jgi:AcrR family transcriptional regulator